MPYLPHVSTPRRPTEKKVKEGATIPGTVGARPSYDLPYLECEQKALKPPLDLTPRGVLRDPFSKGHPLEVLQVHLTSRKGLDVSIRPMRQICLFATETQEMAHGSDGAHSR